MSARICETTIGIPVYVISHFGQVHRARQRVAVVPAGRRFAVEHDLDEVVFLVAHERPEARRGAPDVALEELVRGAAQLHQIFIRLAAEDHVLDFAGEGRDEAQELRRGVVGRRRWEAVERADDFGVRVLRLLAQEGQPAGWQV